MPWCLAGVGEEEFSAEERSRFEQIADQLDAILVDPRKMRSILAAWRLRNLYLEKHDIFSVAPTRMTLPESSSRGSTLDWNGEKSLIKRYGAFVDAEATEELVKL